MIATTTINPRRLAIQGKLGCRHRCETRGSAVADALLDLKNAGYTPDLVVGHGGWGETLFVRDVWRDAPILLHAEFFYQGQGLDVGFDPEISAADPVGAARQARARSVAMLQALTDASHGVSPAQWQRDTFPTRLQQTIDIIHEGVDTDLVTPNPAASPCQGWFYWPCHHPLFHLHHLKPIRKICSEAL